MLKGSGKENYSNIHYVKMTAVELLNFSADKFSFSPFLAVVALANVIRVPVNVFCNGDADVRLLSRVSLFGGPSPPIFWSADRDKALFGGLSPRIKIKPGLQVLKIYSN